MATEEVGEVRGSSNEAENLVSERVSEKFGPFPVAADGCLVLIMKFSCGEESAELSHEMLRAMTGSCSSVVRNSCSLNHRRRNRGGRGALAPPLFKEGGQSPPTFIPVS